MTSFPLLREVPVCPLCDGPCTHRFRRGSWRIGDPMPDHPVSVIPLHDVYEDGVRVYQARRAMPYSEAVRLGVLTEPPAPEEPKRGRRKRRGPIEHRAHLHPEEDRDR